MAKFDIKVAFSTILGMSIENAECSMSEVGIDGARALLTNAGLDMLEVTFESVIDDATT